MVGNRIDAADLSGMKSLGITHILNVAQQLPNYYHQSFVYHKIDLIGTVLSLCVSMSVCVSMCVCIFACWCMCLWCMTVVTSNRRLSRDQHIELSRRGDSVYQ